MDGFKLHFYDVEFEWRTYCRPNLDHNTCAIFEEGGRPAQATTNRHHRQMSEERCLTCMLRDTCALSSQFAEKMITNRSTTESLLAFGNDLILQELDSLGMMDH